MKSITSAPSTPNESWSINSNSRGSIPINKILSLFRNLTKYDKDIDKYFCKGQFVVESTDVGFKPKKNYDDNDYYNYVKIYDWFNNGLEVTEIKKNTKYICEIEYSSQLSEGKTYVESDNCSNDAAYIFGLGKQGIFSCEGEDCEPIRLK